MVAVIIGHAVLINCVIICQITDAYLGLEEEEGDAGAEGDDGEEPAGVLGHGGGGDEAFLAILNFSSLLSSHPKKLFPALLAFRAE